METNGDKAGAVTLTPSKPKLSQKSKRPENLNPNLTSPNPKPTKSPVTKSATKIQRSASKKPNPIASPSPKNKIRERKFVVAKKNSKRENSKTLDSVDCKCKPNSNSKKCVCVAYETLRASQEGFFKIRSVNPGLTVSQVEEHDDEDKKSLIENPSFVSDFEEKLGESEITDASSEKVSAYVKKRRDKLLEAARQSIPESGKVMHLVQAFENILTLPKSKGESTENKESEDDTKKVLKWELPGFRPKAPVTQFSSPELFLTPESLGLGSHGSSSLDGSHGSISNRNSSDGRRSRRNSSESSATFGGNRGRRKTLKATSQQPFKLKTEQRGKSKQEEFMKKVQEMMLEQEKQRIPVAQGLPWTTDEPECLAKPPVKEKTRPVDLVLHSDVRAAERAEFDHQVQEKLSFIEQYKQERERQQKLAEEEELRRLRKDLVPKAQPMPYFDRPFIPRRSEKEATMPKEPKFYHNSQHKKMKSCVSWSEMNH